MTIFATEKQALEHIACAKGFNPDADITAIVYSSDRTTYVKIVDKTSIASFTIGSQRKNLRKFGSIDSAAKFCCDKLGITDLEVKLLPDYV